VTLALRPDALVIRVDDDGGGDGPAVTVAVPGGAAGGGHGITGMRERAHAIGGELAAGPRPEGGFRVSARLPVGA
jgi:signal transduction histidine kinase